jgi:hypothetical protein
VTASVNDEVTAVDDRKNPDGGQMFRSPGAIAVWWLWVLFAVANLIDLAVQGRDHLSLVAAFILLLVTGIVYVTAQRPRIVADAEGLTIVNPVRDHRVGWVTVAGADPAELLRIRCEWPEADRTAQRVIYCWAVHSSRRRQVAAELRARRRSRSGAPGSFGPAGGSGWSGAFGGPAEPAPENDPLRLDTNRIVATLTDRAEKARLETPGTLGTAPASTWSLAALVSIIVPAIALLVIALV